MPDWLDSWTKTRHLDQKDLAKRWANRAAPLDEYDREPWPWLDELLAYTMKNSTPEVRLMRRKMGFK